MKNLPRLILTAVVAMAVVTLSPAQRTRIGATEKAATSGEFLLSWEISDPSDLEFAAKDLDLAEQHFKSGKIPQEHLDQSRMRLERAHRTAHRLLTIRSGGGTLRAFLDAAAKDPERTLTVINAGDAADLETPLPPFVLRNVTWGTVIGVLDNFLQPRGLFLRHVGGDRSDPGVAKSVVCILRQAPNSAETKQPPLPAFESFQIGDYILAEQTIDVIADALRTAWREVDPRSDPSALRVKFHPPTKILLVSGPAPALTVARQVVASLRKNPVPR